VEGTAEYFAHLAIPGTHYHDGIVAGFARQVRSTSLLDMAYEDVVFFSWLGGAHGAPAVKHFIDIVSPGRDRASYRANAETALRPSDWKDFATAFIGNDIRLPGWAATGGADWRT